MLTQINTGYFQVFNALMVDCKINPNNIRINFTIYLR